MKKRSYQNKMDLDLVVCIGTDVPPISTIELMIYGRLLELIEQKNTNILAMDDIFDGYTHTKRGRFELLARLVKKRLINRIKTNSNSHQYEILPKMTYKYSKEMRIYKPKTRKERMSLIREFTMNK